MKIILIIDQEIIDQGLGNFIKYKLGHEIVGEFPCGESVISSNLCFKTDIIMIDLAKPFRKAFEASKKIIWINPKIKILGMVKQIEDVFLKPLIEAGFKGCILKQDIFQELPKAIEKISKNRLHFPEKIDIQKYQWQ